MFHLPFFVGDWSIPFFVGDRSLFFCHRTCEVPFLFTPKNSFVVFRFSQVLFCTRTFILATTLHFLALNQSQTLSRNLLEDAKALNSQLSLMVYSLVNIIKGCL